MLAVISCLSPRPHDGAAGTGAGKRAVATLLLPNRARGPVKTVRMHSLDCGVVPLELRDAALPRFMPLYIIIPDLPISTDIQESSVMFVNKDGTSVLIIKGTSTPLSRKKGIFSGALKFGLLITALLATTAPSFAAPDYEREQRWANEITPFIVVGDPVYFTQKNRHRFLGLYIEEEKANMALVIVHGMGIHPDWGMVGTLRQRLAEEGYATLSIQMPVLAADAEPKAYPAIFPDAAERLQLAVAWLKTKGYSRIAIVSHSNGTRMSRVYMVNNPPDVIAWASLSMTQGDTYEGVKVPILDLYGENDLSHVLAAAAKRKASLSNAASKQKVISDANHFFTDQEEAMVTAVREFLDKINR